MLTPYRLPSSLDPENELMNTELSGARVVCEHANGILKGRWRSLTQLPVDIRHDQDIQIVCDWILAACVLHNIVNRLRNDCDEVPIYVETEDNTGKQKKRDVVSDQASREVRAWREGIKQEVLEFCGAEMR
ncbi:hypothetical protein Ae201684P_019481 [Aphanomyces euteiches]|nr:hypothetical protein Ae201684P_019481 [Aphanomyces euteiches]